MGKAIATYNEQAVTYEVNGEQVSLDFPFVRQYIVRGRADYVTDAELMMFLHTCKAAKLNPLIGGEVHLIKYSKDEAAQIVVGKYAYLKRAYENPAYCGKKDGIVVQRGNEIICKEGTCLYPNESLIGGWCRVSVQRNGVVTEEYKEVALSEYNKGQASWKSKPATMISKVAISQAIRDAFPEQYEGIYSEEEMVASGAIPVEAVEVDAKEKTAAVIDDVITQEERRGLFNAAFKAFGKEEGTAVIKQIMAELKIESTDGMKRSTYNAMIERIAGIADEKQAEEDGYIEELAEPIEAEYTDVEG